MAQGDFTAALLLSQQKKLQAVKASYPELDTYAFGKKHQKAMARLCDKMRGNRYHRISSRAVRWIIAAAVLLALGVTCFAVSPKGKSIIKSFEKYSVFEVFGGEAELQPVGSLKSGYIPAGFELTDCVDSKISSRAYYSDSSGRRFDISKLSPNSEIRFDTEYTPSKTVTHNGIEYTLYFANEDVMGVVWYDGRCVFHIDGNLAEDEILNIAYACK